MQRKIETELQEQFAVVLVYCVSRGCLGLWDVSPSLMLCPKLLVAFQSPWSLFFWLLFSFASVSFILIIISDHFLNTFRVFASCCPTVKGIAYTEMLKEKWM